MFKIIVAVSSGTTAALSSGRGMSFLTSTSRTEIRTIGSTSLGLCDRFWGLLLQQFHLVMKLRRKLLILICKFAYSVLGNPVVPLFIHLVRTFYYSKKFKKEDHIK